MKNTNSSRSSLFYILFWLQILLALGAMGGGVCLILSPDGSLMHMPVSMLNSSPFSNFLIPGMILFFLLGLYPLIVAWCMFFKPTWKWPNLINPFKRYHWSWAASISTGIILIIWISVEVLILKDIHFLHVLYFIWGWVIILLSLTQNIRHYFLLK